jgi:hypothetical protein
LRGLNISGRLKETQKRKSDLKNTYVERDLGLDGNEPEIVEAMDIAAHENAVTYIMCRALHSPRRAATSFGVAHVE